MPIKKPEDFENDKEKDINDRKPKPYRYLKDFEEIQDDKTIFNNDDTFTLMKTDKPKIKFDFSNPAVLSNNKNISKIEEILKKHEEIKKFKDFY